MAKAATTTDLAGAFARCRRRWKFLKFLMASSAIPDFKNFRSLPSGKIASPNLVYDRTRSFSDLLGEN
jgi:hypothetical protein